MSVTLDSRNVMCRKPHLCIWCGGSISKNESAHYRKVLQDGEFFAEHWHPECWDAMIGSYFGYADEFDPMEQERGKTFNESHA